jgi:hypothetical protein
MGSGWQNGIRSHVRLTAMVPAMIAVSTIAPFLLRSLLARNCAATSAGKPHAAFGARRTRGGGLGRDVDHRGMARGIEVRQ